MVQISYSGDLDFAFLTISSVYLNTAFLTISNQQTATFEGRSWLDNSGLLDFRAGLDPGVEKDVSVKSKTSAPVCVFTTNFGVQGIVGGPTNYQR